MTRPGSTTVRTLLHSGTVLLILTMVTGWFAWASFARAHDTVERVGNQTVPAILDVAAARAALAQADHAAIVRFKPRAADAGPGGNAAYFAGPGEEYRSQLAIATQSLTRAAENNVTGAEGSQSLRVIQGLLTSYTSSVEQAATVYRENPDAELWTADLLTAAQLLHDVHDELHGLQTAQLDKLNEEIDVNFGGPASWLSWLIPATLLFGLLGATQVFLTRRFRRRVNPGLLAATLLLTGLIAVAALIFPVHVALDSLNRQAQQASANSLLQANLTTRVSQRILAEEIIGERCASACGPTISVFIAVWTGPGSLDKPPVAGSTREINEKIHDKIGEAGQSRGAAFLIPLGTALVLGSIVGGLYFHIDRYRYRAR